MLRINLLPAYVTQRRLTKRLSFVFAVLFILCVVLPLAAFVSMNAHLNDVAQQADTAEAKKKATDDLKALAATTLAQVKPIQDKLDFVEAVHKNPRDWVKLWNTLADTSPKSSFIYSDAAVSGATMSIKAYSPSVEEVGRYLQAMYQEPDFASVVVDHVPGYPDNVRHLYYLNGTMVFADGASGSSASGGSSGGQGGNFGGMGSSSSGYPGAMGGSGGQSAGGTSASSGYDSAHLAPNGASNIPSDVGPPPAALTGGAPSTPQNGPGGQSMSAGTQPGGGSSSAGYSPAFLKIASANISPFATPDVRDQILRQALRRVVVKTVPKGFDINVTATLKQPIVAPVPPGAAPAAGAGGRPGMGGPGMGGPGMGGPGMGGPPPGMGGRPA